MAEAVLLDTCALLWLVNGDPMTAASRAAIDGAQGEGLGVHVSAISAWEIGTLVARGRLALTSAPDVWFEAVAALPGVRLADLAPRLLIRSAFLPGEPPADPADRIIAATAREHDLVVVTRDRHLLAYAEAGHVRALAC